MTQRLPCDSRLRFVQMRGFDSYDLNSGAK